MSFGYGYPRDQFGYGYGDRPQSFRTSLGMRFIPLLIGLVIAGITMMRGCTEGPFGRNQLRGMDSAQESALGAQAFQQVISQSRVLNTGTAVTSINRIAKRLVEASRSSDFLSLTKLKEEPFQWAVRVVESREQNAFCLPGGKIVVYTGILPAAQTEQGLAVVMGHEIGHALAHHSAERMSQEKVFNIGKLAVAGSIGNMDPAAQRQLFSVINIGAKYGLLRYSRSHETEADHIGILLMAKAGYDPKEAPLFWKRMTSQSRGGAPPEFMSTHPSHETRVRDLEGWMDDAMALYRQSSPAPEAKVSLTADRISP